MLRIYVEFKTEDCYERARCMFGSSYTINLEQITG